MSGAKEAMYWCSHYYYMTGYICVSAYCYMCIRILDIRVVGCDLFCGWGATCFAGGAKEAVYEASVRPPGLRLD
jgi:hypothetical protein